MSKCRHGEPAAPSNGAASLTQAAELERHAAWCLEQADRIRRRALLKHSGLHITRNKGD